MKMIIVLRSFLRKDENSSLTIAFRFASINGSKRQCAVFELLSD